MEVVTGEDVPLPFLATGGAGPAARLPRPGALDGGGGRLRAARPRSPRSSGVDDSGTLLAAARQRGARPAAQRPGGGARRPATSSSCAAARGRRRARRRPSGCPASRDDPRRDRGGRRRLPVRGQAARLSGSRGVIRADDPAELVAALRAPAAASCATADALRRAAGRGRSSPASRWRSRGCSTGGELRVLALFDKPDPLDGPFFEETIYVTPSRLPAADAGRDRRRGGRGGGARSGCARGRSTPSCASNAARALADRGGRRARSAGCARRRLRFGADMSLEELILRHAVGPAACRLARARAARRRRDDDPDPAARACCAACTASRQARAVPGVEERRDHRAGSTTRWCRCPEGDSYLGFIFARGDDAGRGRSGAARGARAAALRDQPRRCACDSSGRDLVDEVHLTPAVAPLSRTRAR